MDAKTSPNLNLSKNMNLYFLCLFLYSKNKLCKYFGPRPGVHYQYSHDSQGITAVDV